MNLTKMSNLFKVTLHSLYDQITDYELIAIFNFPLPLAPLSPPTWFQLICLLYTSLFLQPTGQVRVIGKTVRYSTAHRSYDPSVLYHTGPTHYIFCHASHWSNVSLVLPLTVRGFIGPTDWTPCDTWPIGPTKYWPYDSIVWRFIGPTNQSQYVVQDQWFVCALDQWPNAQTNHWSCDLLFLYFIGPVNWSQDDRHSTPFSVQISHVQIMK